MKVLVIGSGGREHAIAWSLKKSPQVTELYALPGNPGMAALGTCVPGSVEDLDGILAFVEEKDIDLTVIGPEVPLCMGLADLLEDHGHRVFGPRKAAAQLEGSKAFSKDFMVRHGIPTAKYKEVTNLEDAYAALKDFSYPVVVKADGLAAGKGVVIAEDEKTAKETLKEMLSGEILGGAGSKVVLEEFLTGFECSLLCFTDGKTIVPMVSAKDHKQIYDNNKGPNTGGMGTVSPNPFLPTGMEETFQKDILDPFVKGLQEDGLDFRGVIFIGLMIENGKAKVLEFNVRFGDPETQVILMRLDSDLYDIMNAVATSTLDQVEVKWKDEQVTCVVLASGGYPGSYEKGKVITGLDDLPDDIVVFHAGTAMKDGQLVTNGGRVLNVCAAGKNLEETRDKVYKAIEKIHFDGMYCRKDIGLH
ncbi:phosphoribosylamine--glycine ligase [Intestinibaculum porci]|uniref:Phosphoribosylamine--glycine ligase n=1 Tax=Intestinibaculum porci TaxID=2487118 RepID=A0A3G9J6H4_9FIRM|nr:phosphoribosylamine--glycine ligase [Intestinibaculum porci]BBH26212.1 phosphoribosylamine--glycine ligase [Intestinibaculum porci]